MSAIYNIEGDIIEVGIFKGDTSLMIASAIKENNLNKHYFGLDTFTGYVEEDMQKLIKPH